MQQNRHPKCLTRRSLTSQDLPARRNCHLVSSLRTTRVFPGWCSCFVAVSGSKSAAFKAAFSRFDATPQPFRGCFRVKKRLSEFAAMGSAASLQGPLSAASPTELRGAFEALPEAERHQLLTALQSTWTEAYGVCGRFASKDPAVTMKLPQNWFPFLFLFFGLVVSSLELAPLFMLCCFCWGRLWFSTNQAKYIHIYIYIYMFLLGS